MQLIINLFRSKWSKKDLLKIYEYVSILRSMNEYDEVELNSIKNIPSYLNYICVRFRIREKNGQKEVKMKNVSRW